MSLEKKRQLRYRPTETRENCGTCANSFWVEVRGIKGEKKNNIFRCQLIGLSNHKEDIIDMEYTCDAYQGEILC